MIYDYLVVGAGPFGAVFAHEAHKRGKSILVIDRRHHVAGNLYCESKDDINIHVYGAHIFSYIITACMGLCESIC